MIHTKLLIIGSGPAGYSAAIYTARAQLDPIVLAGETSGGQLMNTTEVENYAGFSRGIMGPELMMEMRAQAERFGAKINDVFVTKVNFLTTPFEVWVSENNTADYSADAVILATGAVAYPLGVPGEKKYSGRGVSYCAVCDGAFFRDKKVFLVGGGDAAMEDALALAKFASQVVVVVRRDELKASKIMQERVKKADKVTFRWNTEVIEVLGDGQKISELKLKDNKTGTVSQEGAEGLFVAIGHGPMTDFLEGQVMLNEKGYVVTRLGMDSQSVGLATQHLNQSGLLDYPTMTSVEGVFAAGDNVDFRYRQASTAAGMGTMAALDAEWWLERI
jgi:thioredoxin reductase (NADPH)